MSYFAFGDPEKIIKKLIRDLKGHCCREKSDEVKKKQCGQCVQSWKVINEAKEFLKDNNSVNEVHNNK
jgi:hypothetical protein